MSFESRYGTWRAALAALGEGSSDQAVEHLRAAHEIAAGLGALPLLDLLDQLARQLRVRNLGGIIIVDFIDMRDEEHRRQVHRALEKAMARDPARNKITGVSELGLIEMTRKRTRESLEQLLCEDCPVCDGRGVLKTAETVCYEIFREIMRDARAYDNETLMVLATQGVIDRLLDEESANVADLEEFIGKTISFRVEPDNNPEHFDIVLL